MKSLPYDLCIVGGGLSGLSVAAFVGKQRPELRWLILERAPIPGGAITTYNESGYLAEWGPHGFLDNCAESRHLIELAGLEREVITAPLSRYVRYLCLNGRLQCIPQQPLRILREPLMPWRGKLRILADLWKKPLPGEPTVAQWVEHRFGKDLLPFADAVYTGTYAGDIERLKIDAVMPGVRDLEHKHGSVLRGVLRARKESRRHRKDRGKGLPAMTSFSGGMAMLPEHLAAGLVAQGSLACGHQVQGLVREEQGWRVLMEQGEVVCRHLVLALPVNQGLALLAAALPSMPPPMPAIAEARILSVLLGFDDRARIPFGFGYLAPEREARFTLGALFSSHMFPGRAPEGYHLVEALVGGRRHPERLDLNDDQLITEVCRDLGQLMDLPPPAFATVLRSRSGIPQLEAGYTELLAWRQQLHVAHGDLHLCGFGWKGIGINDMVKEAARIAAEISTHAVAGEKTEVKGVYF
ncbi:protoporphyrinogen oxidase [Desulfobulbus alkaliphilus]|uniref:protoporphyrinogen oxidase n=1 Tax=Desulfobulbus alkaliphilus TaxID=869814 RepID=UPI001964A66F|nr:protoporphyrinogen oxidase [Desulfobulbus alkaliphilus]MBM9538388.1 protoporphyrinogen oxidase [Desulfobulbus alkaliphilus]